MSLGIESHMSHLCFADDVVLVATNARQLQEMIADLKGAAGARGLKIHSGKTKVSTNAGRVSSQKIPSNITVDGEKYEVLSPEESTKYLGRKVGYEDPQGVEFDNRVAKAWGAFSKHKQELTDRRHYLKNRLKLFDAVVTPTLLYGCETWTLRADQQRRLRVVQRKMLRMILNAKRRAVAPNSSSDTDAEDEEDDAEVLEPWQDFLKRAAQWTDEQLEKASIQQWVVQWKKRKWKWAGRLFDAGNNKWSAVATRWQPQLHSRHLCGRRQSRPKKRWDQDFIDYLHIAWPAETKHWHELAADKEWWLSQIDAFTSQGS